MTATAHFDVTAWEPAATDEPAAGPALSRVAVRKTFQGDLDATSEGEGLFCGLADPASGAGYVVSERVTGRLGDRTGSFVLQHGGAMGPGVEPRTFGHVVPGSGTGDLVGMAGTVQIAQDAHGRHTIALDYHLA